jgi:hypothetical protein
VTHPEGLFDAGGADLVVFAGRTAVEQVGPTSAARAWQCWGGADHGQQHV